MAYTAMYRKWRPMVFEDVIGQEHVTKTIKNQIISNRISHAYLFCGTRGTGKTSTAKIFSKAVNCINMSAGNPCGECKICKGINDGTIMDVIEIDAASNNGVDNVREIREEVIYTPSVCKYKVYIIDEVHMLSTGAFNALLKTLEEPPHHIIFILATTEPHKIPPTILSRCQRYDFKRITTNDIKKRIDHILSKENISIDNKSLNIISKAADGSVRDGLSILDQCIAYGGNEITYDIVKTTLGITDIDVNYKIIESILKKEMSNVFNSIERVFMDGIDLSVFINNLIDIFRDMLVIKTTSNFKELLELDDEDIYILQKLSSMVSIEKIISIIETLSQAQQNIKWNDNKRIIIEITAVKLCNEKYNTTNDQLIARLAEVENLINTKRNIVIDKDVNHNLDKEQNKQPIIDTDKNPINKKHKTEDKKTLNAKKNEVKQDVNDESKEKSDINIKKLWPEILEGIKKIGEFGLYGNLQHAEPEYNNGEINIIFDDSMEIIKSMVERESCINIMKDITNKITGKNYKIKCITRNSSFNNNENGLEKIEKKKDIWPDNIKILEE